MRLLRAALHDEPVVRLLPVADAWDAEVEAASSRDLSDLLAAHMLAPGHLAAAVEALPAHAREAFDALLRASGRMPLAAFERRFGALRPMGPGRLERERPWNSPANAAEVLWYRGFVFRAFDRKSAAPVEVIFIPSDMLALLAPAQLAPAAHDGAQTTSVAGEPAAQRDSPLLDDVTTLLCFVQNTPPHVRADGVWDLASRQAVARMLRNPDGADDAYPDGRFAFLLHVIERLGWTRAQDGALRLVAAPVAGWLLETPARQRQILFDAWLEDSEWNDLAHVDGLELEMTHAWSNDPVLARRAIVSLVAAGADLATLAEHVKQSAPDFARPDGRYDTWHLRDPHSGVFLSGFEYWDQVEGALIHYLVGKPLRWLEAAGVSPAAPADEAALTRPFAVNTDGAIVVAPRLRFDRFQLARVADWLETQRGAFVYHLTPRSLKRAGDQGIKPGRVAEFLLEKGGAPLPDSVTRAIARWVERGAELRLEGALLLRARDTAALDAALKIEIVRRALIERPAPTLALIRARDARAVRSAIAASGLLVD